MFSRIFLHLFCVWFVRYIRLIIRDLYDQCRCFWCTFICFMSLYVSWLIRILIVLLHIDEFGSFLIVMCLPVDASRWLMEISYIAAKNRKNFGYAIWYLIKTRVIFICSLCVFTSSECNWRKNFFVYAETYVGYLVLCYVFMINAVLKLENGCVKKLGNLFVFCLIDKKRT